jgi:twitching motility protein PilT
MVDEILRSAVAAHASDVHIHAGAPPLFRIDTLIHSSPLSPVAPDAVSGIAKSMMGDRRWTDFQLKRDADFSYEVPALGRFRVNAHFQRGTVALAIRLVSNRIRTLAELLLPDAIIKLAGLTRGLVLVTGPTGCGKSTTLAAMIDQINRREHGHIVTLEDPIEFVLTGVNCLIEQREVGSDVPDFASGLRHVLRQDPDTILLGEMRDLETTSAAITAAETGHLVLSTLHTQNASQTIERIIDIYPAAQQSQIRSMLASSLQAVVSQTLLPRSDEPGMIPAAEIMICTQPIKSCIRDNRIFEIPNVIETSRSQGMQSLDFSLQQLCRNGYITRQHAIAAATHPEKFERTLAA